MYVPNFIAIGQTFCGWTYGQMDGCTCWRTDISPMLLGWLGGVDL